MSTSKSILEHNINAREILLVFPGKYRAPDPQVPLPVIHIASPLKNEGYKVRILDMRTENYLNYNIGNPLFVGISCMSGLQIKHGLEFAKKLRTQNQSCPIVWGGVHPTLLPEQTAKNEYVDVVVRGEGELIITELASKLTKGEPLDDVAGITYKDEGTIKSNPDGEVIDLDKIPVDLPFNLLQLEKYPSLKSGRFHIQTSRGCPNRCGFCYNSIFNKRLWRGKSPERVLDEIEHILHRFPNVKIIDPIDDNVFVDKERVERICQGIIDRKIKVAWRANCRFDYLAAYDREFVHLLEKAGCTELDFGGETGAERLQQMICKDVTADQMVKAVENLKKWAPNIEPYVSWMSGLPTETDDDLNATFNLMDRMCGANPKTQHYGIFVYTPFPSPVLEHLPSEFKPPQSLEEWGKIEVFHFKPPWHSKNYVKKLESISAVTRYMFFPRARIEERGFSFKLGYAVLNRIAKYRWNRRYFGLPLELKLVNGLARRLRGYLRWGEPEYPSL